MQRTVPGSGPSRRSFYAVMAAVACGVAVCTVLVYRPALANGFVNWDDEIHVYRQPGITQSGWPLVRWSATTFTNGAWHPLTWLSFAVDWHLWGAKPFGFHLTNVLLHGVNAGLTVWLAGLLLVRRSGLTPGAALVGAGLVGVLFGVHPLHVESVAWISERKDVLYGLCWLLGLLAYTAYAQAGTRAARVWAYGACLGCFVLALASKTMAVTFPAVLLLLDWYPFARLRRGALLRVVVWEKVSFVLLSGAASVLTMLAVRTKLTAGGAHVFPVMDRLWIAAWAPGYYLAKTILPLHLVPFYPRPLVVTPLSASHLAGYAVLVGMTVAAVAVRRRWPVAAAAWAYFLVTLLPVLGFAQIGLHAVAIRYLYLPLLGPLMLVGAGVAYAWDRARQLRTGLAAAAALLVAWYAVGTVDQIGIWKDSVSLWEYVVAQTPPHTLPLYNLGQAYLAAGDLDRAADAWRRTIALDPRHSRALNALGTVAINEGEIERAHAYYVRAVDANPANPEAQYNLGGVLELLGQHDEACVHYREFRRLAPPEAADRVALVGRKCP